MQLVLDIGNTNTHVGIVADGKLKRDRDFRTEDWSNGRIEALLDRFIGKTDCEHAVLCSVVPSATKEASFWLSCHPIPTTLLTHKNCGVPIDYPDPESIGPDRLANARAALETNKGPVVVVDFGTALTFDIVDGRGHYVGGIIAPGISAMTDYLHEKTALLPRITLSGTAPGSVIGKSTAAAMQVGAVHGYRGLVRALLQQIQQELGVGKMPVIATGGTAEILARSIPEITRIDPKLTLEGLRLTLPATAALRAPKVA